VIAYDYAILGQGIAGTTLAWQLRFAGHQVLVIDRGATNTASTIAAGLLTPITGQRLAANWRWSEAWPAAVGFYQRIERETHSRFFQTGPMVRLFANVEERTAYEQRADTLLNGLVEDADPPGNSEWFATIHGSFAMAPAGRLDGPGYLEASRKVFDHDGAHRIADLDIATDIDATGPKVRFPRLGATAQKVIFCQGYTKVPNPFFPDLQFRGAKGEILTLRIPGLEEHRVVHRGIWLMPMGDDLFRAGSTYDREHLDDEPTSVGRAEILGKLDEFLKLPYEVIEHKAAVRPVIFAGRPVIAQNKRDPRFGLFNGLGSKGALLAPYFAKQYAEYLCGRGKLDPEVDATKQGVALPRLTEEAHQVVQKVLEPGDFAIDATAGNGRDAKFLAETVGPSGTVFAFDVQPLAIERTTKLLADAGICNVTLLHRDHGNLQESIPTSLHGRIGAAMFNLGHLPGGDRTLITQVNSTLPALQVALELLRPGGVLTVMAYTGHPGGLEEANAVRSLLNGLPLDEFEYRERISGSVPLAPLGRGVRGEGMALPDPGDCPPLTPSPSPARGEGGKAAPWLFVVTKTPSDHP